MEMTLYSDNADEQRMLYRPPEQLGIDLTELLKPHNYSKPLEKPDKINESTEIKISGLAKKIFEGMMH